MAVIYFIRHGKTILNKEGRWSGRTDCDLSPEGAEGLKTLFADYSQKEFKEFYCSPLKRTRQTLDAIIPGKTPIIDSRVIERDFGDWEGQPYNNITPEETERYIRWEIQPPNGETADEVKERVLSFVEDVFTKNPDDANVLVVSHATVLRMIRDLFLPEMEKGPIRNGQVLIVSPKEFANYFGK